MTKYVVKLVLRDAKEPEHWDDGSIVIFKVEREEYSSAMEDLSSLCRLIENSTGLLGNKLDALFSIERKEN